MLMAALSDGHLEMPAALVLIALSNVAGITKLHLWMPVCVSSQSRHIYQGGRFKGGQTILNLH